MTFLSDFHVSRLCSNSVRTRAARAILPISPGLAVTSWRVFQRWESSAKPLPLASHRTEQRIPGTCVSVQLFHAFRLLRGDADAVTCTFVPAVGQGRYLIRVFPQHRQDLLPGRSQVVDIARQYARDPHRRELFTACNPLYSGDRHHSPPRLHGVISPARSSPVRSVEHVMACFAIMVRISDKQRGHGRPNGFFLGDRDAE
jgi:hypothetical protein